MMHAPINIDPRTDRARSVRIEDECARRGIKLIGRKNERVGPCPKCGGHDRFSINVAKQVFCCRVCEKGGDVIDLVQHLDVVDFPTALTTLSGEPPLKTNSHAQVNNTAVGREGIAARFDYNDESGRLLFQVRRIEYEMPDGSFILKDGKHKKTFRQKRPDPAKPGAWIQNVDGVRTIPYRLPELIEAIALERQIVIVEGEAKVDLLRSWNVPATCCSGGAKKWRTEHAEFLRGANVVILPDNDDAGRKHADAVGASLHGIALSVRVLELPGLPDKGDIVDWAKAGGTVEQLHELIVRDARPWEPAPAPTPEQPVGGDQQPQPGGAENNNKTGERARQEHSEPEIDLAAIFNFLGDAPAAPPRELIKNHLPASGVVITGGQSGAGKTFISIHKTICLATAMPYFGHKIVERVGTAYIAAEGRGAINNRFAAALAKHSITDNLPIAWIRQLPDFASADGIKLFIRQMKELDRRFCGDFGLRLGHITLDTVAAGFAMKDEDDNSEATRVCNIMRRIGQDTEALFNAVHHYGKNPESGLRGASAWKGSADVIEGVLADIDPLSGKASNRELVCTKSRDGEQGPMSAFELQFVELGLDEDNEIYGSCCVVPGEGESRFDKTATPNKGQRAISAAIHEVLNSIGQIIVPRADMAPVKAAKVIDVRKEFDRFYVVADDDPLKAADAKRMAFKRALDKLPLSQFGYGSAEGADWIWSLK